MAPALAMTARSTKPTTIHGLAQCGDLIGFRNLIRENPLIVNERNPVIAQTPLHVAAGYNNVKIVKLLLEWKGTEKVELEAKNMYGETPLHMAAKNGCNDAALLLLSNGAFLEAKANNGMAPLHLAVWHSLQSKDCLTVKTLLEYYPDCNAKDDDGLTPVDHLSPEPENEKLRKLLTQYMEEERKRKAIEACARSKAKMDEPECEYHILLV